MTELEELSLLADRLEGVQACRNLMGLYSYLHTAFRNNIYVDLWAKRDDDCLMMPWGVYDGYDSFYRCYREEHGDRDDPGMDEDLKGAFMMHQMDTEVIEVAEDGQTARGVWISPGHETCGDPLKAKGTWCWGKYQVEFIKENGVWKFWKLRLYPLFIAPYNQSWAELKPYDPDEVLEEAPIQVDRKVVGETWNYSPQAVYPASEPEPPLPYATYEPTPMFEK
jgi:hypothetical protein